MAARQAASRPPRKLSAGEKRARRAARGQGPPKKKRRPGRRGGAVDIPACTTRRALLRSIEEAKCSGVLLVARARKLRITQGYVEFITNELIIPEAGGYVCGQAAMMSFTGRTLEQLGVEAWHIAPSPLCNCMSYYDMNYELNNASGQGPAYLLRKPLDRVELATGVPHASRQRSPSISCDRRLPAAACAHLHPSAPTCAHLRPPACARLRPPALACVRLRPPAFLAPACARLRPLAPQAHSRAPTCASDCFARSTGMFVLLAYHVPGDEEGDEELPYTAEINQLRCIPMPGPFPHALDRTSHIL